MKTKYLNTLIPMLALAGHCVAAPLGTTFTYQGRLYEGNVPASGEYVFQFGLFTSLEGGVNLGTFPPSGPPLIVPVTNGLFTTTLDFGASAFRGEARFLQVAVRTNDPAATVMTPLLPRQELKPVPYALHAFSATEATHATNADLAAKVAWGSGSLIGMPAGFADGVDNDTTYTAGLGLSLSGTTFGVNPAFGDGRYWTLAGNGLTDPNAQFLGTIDDRSLTMRVNSRTALCRTRLSSRLNRWRSTRWYSPSPSRRRSRSGRFESKTRQSPPGPWASPAHLARSWCWPSPSLSCHRCCWP